MSYWLMVRSFARPLARFGERGMGAKGFDKNILTDNPGWDRTCATLPDFDDLHRFTVLMRLHERPFHEHKLLIHHLLKGQWVQRHLDLRQGANGGGRSNAPGGNPLVGSGAPARVVDPG